jgi:hypothetical protein
MKDKAVAEKTVLKAGVLEDKAKTIINNAKLKEE